MDFSGLNELSGLKFMPVRSNKMPIVKGWQSSTDQHDLSNCDGVGLVCGKLSGGLEVIDCDVKYSIDGKLFDRYKAAIHAADSKLLNKLTVQTTRGGGYHLIYRCSVIQGNLKLANRHTTPDEKKETYDKAYELELSKSTEDEKAKKVAQKSSENDKVRVLLETRGEGGYVMCAPSPGYDFIFGDLVSISEITPEERETLFSVARQFNEVIEEVQVPKKTVVEKTSGLSVFDDYNQRGDVISLLQQNGWKVVSNKGNKTHLLRPGQSTAQTSGNFDHDKNWFSVFTTSTEFEPQHAYLPYAVYAYLECNKDFSLASKKLFELGYGERQKTKEEAPKQSTRVIQSRVDVATVDLSLFATPADYDNYLSDVRSGNLKMGRTTGSPLLDNHFLFKEADFINVNGIDNVGKTRWIWWMLLIAAMLHGMRSIIFSSENTIGSFMRTMIQLYWGRPLYGEYAITEEEYHIAKDFVERHFKIIKAQEQLYNYKDIINLFKIARANFGDFENGMLDPYNSLKIDLSGFSKISTHEYHYEALSEIKAYGQQTKFSTWINHHAVTSAIRQKDADKKYSVAPRKEDTEGGGKTANKSDSFITIHRITNHPTEWMNTEVHVRKIKETETGGRPTFIDEPVKFKNYKGGNAFCELLPDGTLGLDPIEEWHIAKSGRISSKKILTQENIWQPFKDNDGKDVGF